MKSIGRKGQGAMEYLMTYGWAILVVMVVGIVMWQMGIFNIGGGTATTASGFARLKPLLATAVYSNSSDLLTVTFANGAGGTAAFAANSVSINCGGGAQLSIPTPTSVANGDTFKVSDSPGTGIAKGDPYVCKFTLDYTVTVAGTSVARTDTGTIRGPVD